MRALSVRQPFAELILRGMNTVEYRSRPTRIIGERFWIYASGKKWPVASGRWPVGGKKAKGWSGDLAIGEPPAWMVELANGMRLFPGELPTGVIVGSATIEKVTPPDAGVGGDGLYRWHLADVRRVTTLRKPTGHPQPVWFLPFGEE
jgi:hypothetical protein